MISQTIELIRVQTSTVSAVESKQTLFAARRSTFLFGIRIWVTHEIQTQMYV